MMHQICNFLHFIATSRAKIPLGWQGWIPGAKQAKSGRFCLKKGQIVQNFCSILQYNNVND